MSKDTNKNDDLDLNLEEVLTPIVEKAVANSMPKEEKAETKVERKEIKVSNNTYTKDPVVDADWKTKDGIRAYLGGLTQAHFQKNWERKDAFYKRAESKTHQSTLKQITQCLGEQMLMVDLQFLANC